MTDLTREAATSLLSDAVALWRLQPGLVEDVVDAAVDCLVADVDTPSLRVLAGADPKDSRWVLEPLIEDTVRELGLTELLSISPQRAALTVMLRRLEANEVSASELVGWAHTHVGHDGDPDCQRFVDLYDAYGLADYTGQSLSELDRWTREEADAFLAGRPSPRRWSTRTWDEPRAVIVGPRRWRRRFTVRSRRSESGDPDHGAEGIVDAVSSFFAEHEGARLRLPSGWFGRPHDNLHQLSGVAIVGDHVLVTLDGTQVLTLEVKGASADDGVLRVEIRGGRWDWTEHGGVTEHSEVLGPGSVEFHAFLHR